MRGSILGGPLRLRRLLLLLLRIEAELLLRHCLFLFFLQRVLVAVLRRIPLMVAGWRRCLLLRLLSLPLAALLKAEDAEVDQNFLYWLWGAFSSSLSDGLAVSVEFTLGSAGTALACGFFRPEAVRIDLSGWALCYVLGVQRRQSPVKQVVRLLPCQLAWLEALAVPCRSVEPRLFACRRVGCGRPHRIREDSLAVGAVKTRSDRGAAI